MLTRLFDAILDAECHTEQETANFLRLGMGNLEWLVDAGYILMVWLMAMAMAVGTWGVSRIPQVCSSQETRQALVRLQLLSAVQHMHERLPFLSGEGWDGMAR